MHHQRLCDGSEPANRHEVLRLVGELTVEERIDSKRRFRRREERVAVGSRLSHRLGADLRVGTSLILYDNLLAPHLGEPLAHRARDDVSRAAGGQRHDEPDGLCRIVCARAWGETAAANGSRRTSASALKMRVVMTSSPDEVPRDVIGIHRSGMPW